MLLYGNSASKGYSMVTEYLLENGANPNLLDNLEVTSLIAATRKQGTKECGADVSPVSLDMS